MHGAHRDALHHWPGPYGLQTLPSALTPHWHRRSHLALIDPERRAFLVSHITGEETEAVAKKPAPNHR